MKKIILVIFVLIIQLFTSLIYCQEFEFKFYFEDSQGNHDTLTIGYDIDASDSIDTEFNEENIILKPLNPVFDVRISDEWSSRRNNKEGTFHTKKQILAKRDCYEMYPINNIDILTNNWPVKIFWDSTLFFDECIDGSLFTSFTPGRWWDTGGQLAILRKTGSISITPWEPNYTKNRNYINVSSG